MEKRNRKIIMIALSIILIGSSFLGGIHALAVGIDCILHAEKLIPYMDSKTEYPDSLKGEHCAITKREMVFELIMTLSLFVFFFISFKLNFKFLHIYLGEVILFILFVMFSSLVSTFLKIKGYTKSSLSWSFVFFLFASSLYLIFRKLEKYLDEKESNK